MTIEVNCLDWTAALLAFQQHGGDLKEVLEIERAFGVEPLTIVYSV